MAEASEVVAAFQLPDEMVVVVSDQFLAATALVLGFTVWLVLRFAHNLVYHGRCEAETGRD